MKKRIFFDMDGVLAKWNQNASIEEVAAPGYFLNLELEDCVAKTMEYLIFAGYEVQILTSVFNDNHSREEKIKWLKNNCPFFKGKINFCVYGESKAKVVNATEQDILIDDFTPNLKDWCGIGIKFLNGINGTKGTWDGYTVSGKSTPQIIATTIAAIANISALAG